MMAAALARSAGCLYQEPALHDAKGDRPDVAVGGRAYRWCAATV